MDFGVISEGPIDQLVLENILFGFFEDKNLLINPLQPKPGESGNWDKVFKYCASKDFEAALTSEFRVDFLIIQMDTDFMRRQDVPAAYRIELTNLLPAEVATAMRNKIIEIISPDLYQQYAQRIIFAIAVDSIECWFLPIYFPNRPRTAAKTTNCIATLNTVLPQAEGFSIHAKEEKYYRTISRNFLKKRDLERFAQRNSSLGLFLNELQKVKQEL